MSVVNMKRPVMLGVALTNRPHVRLKGHPIEILDNDGEPVLRVPFMISGKYSHPHGDLDITPEVMDKFIENMEAGAADNELGLDARHMPERGSLGWFEPALGGKVVKEKLQDGGFGLVGYAKPTGEDILDIVKRGAFRYASLEFHPNYRSNVKQRYLSEDFEPYVDKGEKEFNMFELKVNEDGMVVIEAENVPELQKFIADSEQAASLLEAQQATIAEQENKLAQLEEALDKARVELEAQIVSDEPELSEREIELQARVYALEKKAAVQNIDLEIEKAKQRVDENGMGHSAAFLNAVRSLMLAEPVGEIALEDESDIGKYAEYVRNVAKVMLETVPGQVQVETRTLVDDKKELDAEPESLYELGRADAKTIWSK